MLALKASRDKVSPSKPPRRLVKTRCTDTIRSISLLVWGDQTWEQYSNKGRTYTVKALINRSASFVKKFLYNQNKCCFARAIIHEICAEKDKLLSKRIPKSLISCTSCNLEPANSKFSLCSRRPLRFDINIQLDLAQEICSCQVSAQLESSFNAFLKLIKPFWSLILAYFLGRQQIFLI